MMADHPVKRPEHPEKNEKLSIDGHYQKKNKFFAMFLISCAIIVAGFALTAVFAQGENHWLRGEETSSEQVTKETGVPGDDFESSSPTDLQIPENSVPVFSTDLSLAGHGSYYMINESVYTPDIDAILNYDHRGENSTEPMVLILHTHTSECYAERADGYLEEELGTVTYSTDDTRNVIAVGAALCERLTQNGIRTIHCKTYHDKEGMGGSYARAAESIRFYLAQYPSIRLVIDLHRDAILTEDGEYVRAVTELEGDSMAQVMSVVGSSGSGVACENWQKNLSLALRLRALLNSDGASICRPVTLRNSTYNQELAPTSLLLEIGTGANTVEEARRAAEAVGDALAELILK